MLTFGAIHVIHRGNYLSESQIGQSYQSQYSLHNIDTMKHTIGAKMAKGVPFCLGVPFCPRSEQNGPIPYFVIFAKSQEYHYTCLHFVSEYMYWPSLKIPAKYNDNRLDIFNVGSVFP